MQARDTICDTAKGARLNASFIIVCYPIILKLMAKDPSIAQYINSQVDKMEIGDTFEEDA
jgi:hypothetical protein